MKMEKHKCQMTVGEWDSVSGSAGYGKCSRPAKFRVPKPEMGVEYVCGIHARSLNIMFERIGSSKRCQPLNNK